MLRLDRSHGREKQPNLEILQRFTPEERKADEVQGLIEIGGEG